MTFVSPSVQKEMEAQYYRQGQRDPVRPPSTGPGPRPMKPQLSAGQRPTVTPPIRPPGTPDSRFGTSPVRRAITLGTQRDDSYKPRYEAQPMPSQGSYDYKPGVTQGMSAQTQPMQIPYIGWQNPQQPPWGSRPVSPFGFGDGMTIAPGQSMPWMPAFPPGMPPLSTYTRPMYGGSFRDVRNTNEMIQPPRQVPTKPMYGGPVQASSPAQSMPWTPFSQPGGGATMTPPYMPSPPISAQAPSYSMPWMPAGMPPPQPMFYPYGR